MEKEIKVTPLYYDYLLENKFKVVIQVGGRFSGKSQNEQIRLVSNLASKERYKLLVIEDLESGMADGFYAGLRERIDTDFEHSSMYNPKSRTAYIKNIVNGNEVIFRGYATEQQKLNVKKLNGITEILVEEGEWLDYNGFMSLLQQLRGGNIQDRKLTILMNPINPDCFVNQEFILKNPDKVLEYFDDEPTRPKIFTRNIRAEFENNGELIVSEIEVLVVQSVHQDNPFLTIEQRASIESLKKTDYDKYLQLAKAKFTYPKGALISKKNYFSLSKFDISQAASLKAVIDTASSGKDSATIGIYAKTDDEHHYLIDCLKDSDDAKKVIPRFISMINKYNPQEVYIEKNHEGLYYESEIKRGILKNIIVNKFHSSENKHEKILGQSGRMIEHLYVRDDGGNEYNSFLDEFFSYNKDVKKNKHDDCIDNVAMYFKHTNKTKWGW